MAKNNRNDDHRKDRYVKSDREELDREIRQFNRKREDDIIKNRDRSNG